MANRQAANSADWVDAGEAAMLLGVRKSTLYAYVSRGKLTASSAGAHNQSLYRRSEVEGLLRQRGAAHRPREVARATLAWGLPVLESSLTLIDSHQLYYRGMSARVLAGNGNLEAAACVLWQCRAEDVFGPASIHPPYALPEGTGWPDLAELPLSNRMLAAFGLLQARCSTSGGDFASGVLARRAGVLLRLSAAAALGTSPSSEAIDRQFGTAWSLGRQAREAVRAALVLCADHELNASGFVARCVASTGADLGMSVVAGLAALSGGLHGGMTERVEAMWDEIHRDRGDPRQRLARRLDRGEEIPGFGHPLYPDGDPRAADILARLPRRAGRQALLLAEHVLDLTGRRPALDFALVALRRAVGAPEGGAFAIFAVGRTVGWLAHAIEQRETGALIRPRAAYVGPLPARA